MARNKRDRADDGLFRRSGDTELERNLNRAVDESSDRVRDAVTKALQARFNSAGKLTLSA